jgi:simple sugar transport system ATP-binding protein
MAVADQVVVLRGGKLVGTADPKQTNEEGLAQLMVGRDVVLRVEKSEAHAASAVLEIKDLVVTDDRGHTAVDHFELTLRAGEILGIAGVEGNGQRELVEAVCGMRHRKSGEVLVAGAATPNMNPRQVHDMGVAHIPEDREKDGLVATYSIADNLVLDQYNKAPFANRGVRAFNEISAHAAALVEKFDIRTPSAANTASSLSGGNKQKVVVARELTQNAKVIVASQPTRGVDVGSIEFIHNQLVAARDAGAGILLVSAELDEILSLSDRIAVIFGGKIVAIFNSGEADRTQIGRLMAGGN